MEENLKYNRSGIIKTRFFAIVVLVLSCSLAMTAYRSLMREFEGRVMGKEMKSGFIFYKDCDLYINPDYKTSVYEPVDNDDVINVLVDNLDQYQKIGVSSFVYQEAVPPMLISKKAGSPLIFVNGEKFVDKGFAWIFFSLLGMVISALIYTHTLKKLPGQDSNKVEDIEI